MTNDFDPKAKYYDSEGFEYDSFKDYFLGHKNHSNLNWFLKTNRLQDETADFRAHYSCHYRTLAESGAWGQFNQEKYAGCHVGALSAANITQAASDPGGDGRPGAVAPASVAVHPAVEPEVPRGLGA